MPLSPEEIESIKGEAERLYPFDNPRKNMHHDNQGQRSRQQAYIRAVTAEREKAKVMIENIRSHINDSIIEPSFLAGLIQKEIDNYSKSIQSIDNQNIKQP